MCVRCLKNVSGFLDPEKQKQGGTEASVAHSVTTDSTNASEKCLVGQWTYIACDEYMVRLPREAARYPLADFIH
jgi:hypothetical protein